MRRRIPKGRCKLGGTGRVFVAEAGQEFCDGGCSSLTSPVLTSSPTSKLSRSTLLTIQPTLHHPFGVQVPWACWSRSGTAKQRSETTQTRASALAMAAAMAAAIISSVSSTSAMPLLTKADAKWPDPDLRRHQPDQTPGERFLARAAIKRPLLRRAQGHHPAGMIDSAGVGPDSTLARPRPWLAGGRHSLIVALGRAGIGEDRCGLGPIADLGDKLPGVPPVLQLQP
jgi:hypothetical protein